MIVHRDLKRRTFGHAGRESEAARLGIAKQLGTVSPDTWIRPRPDADDEPATPAEKIWANLSAAKEI